MDNTEFCNLTRLAAMFDGQTSHTVGRALKEIGLRSPTGKPTPLALSQNMVQATDGPQPWITLWLWHRETTIPWLEKAGMQRKQIEQTA